MTLQEGNGVSNKGGSRRLSARKLNQFERRVLQGTRALPGQVVKSNQYGTTVQTIGGSDFSSVPEGGSSIKTVKLVSVEDDTLTVRFLDASGVATGDNFSIAKPFVLRRSPFNGKTIGDLKYVYVDASTRTVTMPGFPAFVGIEEIRPSYRAGVELEIAGVDGKQLELSGTFDPSWIDINVDGRAWAIRGFARQP